ncbi:CGCGG family putative rSAM-modified RiPP protein [Haloplanus aerogenes]|uniref:CGCGG family rSAM-modified RiPP protein n=1 Tax=Haloplanus aerogenes TaxID=660522 RepID=A0A3M0CWF6_9EURY|nr:CGCGG family rSAM-modified RiPP protein [Haloplanus aerogenes]AZH25986.1 CGCGG family rSAM-modified RiPP protein [Haloplanus aerogenes]RMB11686.1 putative CGCGG family rSAM target protein [Haloplanus aerogenes]
MPETYAGREPVTMRRHDRPWIADLETADHASDRQLTVTEAVDAVEQTYSGRFVDLVTPEQHGHPSSYLYEPVRTVARSVDIEDEGRCSCGGYVTRVAVD